MDNSITVGLDPGITITTSTYVPDNTFYVYGNSSINSSGVTYTTSTSTTGTASYVTYSGVIDPNWFKYTQVPIKFGFIIKFKRSTAKIEKSWTDDLQPKEESKLKRIL